ncbi:MAG: type II toxin-antitoxin system RelE/ParE family toxin [Candidatus Aenigmarchaeota archaeon]|nr:type II toxin-antitoxin system RelE/ParE family toxin [Candidatus Aenigmarchaeota archaeon]
MAYNVLVADSVIEFLDTLSKSERDRIMKRLHLLEERPHSAGEPRGKFWILKVGRTDYRLAFRIVEEEHAVRVTAIEKRKSHRYKEFYQ